MTRTRLRSLLAVFVLTAPQIAAATTIHVVPGPGTPVQDAIDAAPPGATIRLAGGNYPESVTITKPLKLYGVASSYLDAEPEPAVIAPGCTPGTTGITVAADGVTIRDLRVLPFTENGIAIHGRSKVRVQRVLTSPNCHNIDANAGIDVEASTRIKLDHIWSTNTTLPAGTGGIRIAALAPRAHVHVDRSVVGWFPVNILLEDCAAGSVRLSGNNANFGSGVGILLRNTDGAILKKNIVVGNAGNGIETEIGSDDNVITGNRLEDNAVDVVDGGSANCWKNNDYVTGTVPGCP